MGSDARCVCGRVISTYLLSQAFPILPLDQRDDAAWGGGRAAVVFAVDWESDDSWTTTGFRVFSVLERGRDGGEVVGEESGDPTWPARSVGRSL